MSYNISHNIAHNILNIIYSNNYTYIYIYIYIYIYYIYCIYKKIPKDLSLNIIKIRLLKNLVKDIKAFLKKKKKESDNMVVNDTKICQKREKKRLLSVEKKYYKMS